VSYFRVVYQHQYAHAVEEVVYTERFKTAQVSDLEGVVALYQKRSKEREL